jgi:hypothetical protein
MADESSVLDEKIMYGTFYRTYKRALQKSFTNEAEVIMFN